VTEPSSIAADPRGPGWYRRWGKRAFDLALTLVACVVALPVATLLAFLVRRKLGRPVLFRQQRPGLGGQPFTLLKFLTMSETCDKNGNLLPDGERLTRFGRFLRGTSLDELPELWNVLRGDMSLVGPRPLLMQYLKRYTPEQARRHQAKPGITGWAQVNGRNALSWEEKFALDVWYVDHVGLSLDARILWRTVGQVLSRRGVSPEGRATMPEFQGSRETEER
jgi:sugar transferase EpsL